VIADGRGVQSESGRWRRRWRKGRRGVSEYAEMPRASPSEGDDGGCPKGERGLP
jgi:hypothetical protein